ncbi:hypothetical protein TPL01_12720 [Sulfuriferula plumbiphila]|uniref:Uncharacterized protein n=1 Tax=Sulfuriferula plumbiphila TaxID=171865 RepID=A0A512L6M1_9PROT|nr:hypothetical protein SFPGR_22830 [Sulfuriferula plumbiphila]GEP30134.1 hypothetical protein TPL01_12720 [Sulfuriferula plumbiphila]
MQGIAGETKAGRAALLRVGDSKLAYLSQALSHLRADIVDICIHQADHFS